MSRPSGGRRAQGARGSRAGKYGLRTVALVYLGLILVLPVAMVFYRTFENGLQPVLAGAHDPRPLHALYLTVAHRRVAVPLNTLFGVFCALLMVRRSFPGKSLLERAHRRALCRLAGRRRPVARAASTARTGLVGRLAGGSTASRSSSRGRQWCWRPSSCRCRSWYAR